MSEFVAPIDRLMLIQTFVRIVDAGNLSIAATQLGTTQPTISRRLQTLEQSLGLHLIRRTTHTMKLTEDGERCYERAKELMANWESFESDLKGARAEAKGNLRIAVPHAFGQDRLVVLLAEFLRLHPGITVEWFLRDDVQDFVTAGVDCAIQVGKVLDLGAIAVRLSEIPRFVVASPELLREWSTDPKSPADLESLPWLALSTFYKTSIDLTHVETHESVRLSIRPRMSTDSLYALRSAAAMGLGVAVGSAWLLVDDIAAGRLVQLMPQWQADPLPVHIVYPAAPYYPARLRSFVQFMQARVATSLATLQPRTD